MTKPTDYSSMVGGLLGALALPAAMPPNFKKTGFEMGTEGARNYMGGGVRITPAQRATADSYFGKPPAPLPAPRTIETKLDALHRSVPSARQGVEAARQALKDGRATAQDIEVWLSGYGF